MKALLVADLHAHNHEAFATTTDEGRNSRFQAILDALNHIRHLVYKHADVVFFLGDMFHSRTKVDVDVFSATWKAWKAITDEVEHAYFLVGNHDQYNKVGSIHSLEAFRELGTVIDQPLIERVGDLSFAAHPFTTNMSQWHGFVKMIPPVDLFLFHQGLCEAATGAFNISIKAEVGYTDMPLDRARFCWGGHYHKPQEIGEERRVGYVGSPLQHGFGERTEDKSVVLYDSETKTFKRLPIAAPKFVLFENEVEFFAALKHSFDPEQFYTRVRTESQNVADQIKRKHPQVQVEMTAKEEFEERRVSTDVVSSDRTLLTAYIEQNPNDLNPARLLSFGLQMLAGDEA